MDQPPGREVRLSRRLAWAATAQVASSLTNFTLYIGLLAAATTDGFGRWVAVLAAAHLVVAIGRSLVFEPMVSAGQVDQLFSWAWARRRTWQIGSVGAVVAAAVGWRVAVGGTTLVAFAVAVPLLVRQDGQRSLAWARGRPERSVVLDGVWLAVTLAGMGGLALVLGLDHGPGGEPGAGAANPAVPSGWTGMTADHIVACWLVGGLVSAVAGHRLVERWQPADAPPPSSTTRERPGRVAPARLDARRRSQTLLTTGRNLLPIVVATAVDPAAAGLLKAALLPYTPVLSLLAGLRMVVLPGMQRAAEASPAALDRYVIRVAAAHLVGGGAAVGLTLAIVTVVGRRVDLPDALQPSVVGWGAVVAVIVAVATPLADGFGFGRRSGPVVGRRLAEIALEWGLVLGVALLVGGDRVVVGWALGVALGALLWLVPGLGAAPRHRQPPDRRPDGRGPSGDRPPVAVET